MTTDTLQDALAILAEIWALSPDVRLGQLFAHLGFLGEAHVGKSLGDIEDLELIAVLERHRDELLARDSGAHCEAQDQGSDRKTVAGSAKHAAADRQRSTFS